MYRAGGLLPWRGTPAGVEYLLLQEVRYNREVLHVAGGRVEPFDADIRATIAREFVEEVGAWPADLEKRVRAAPLSTPTGGYCLATVDVGDVSEPPPPNTHWVRAPEAGAVKAAAGAAAGAAAALPLSWLAERCIGTCRVAKRRERREHGGRLELAVRHGDHGRVHRVQSAA
jgi:hypothetical protein